MVAKASALAVALGLVAGCGTGVAGSGAATSTRALSIVATTDVWGDVATQIAGDRAKITSIITDPSADPHAYEANVKTQLALSKATVVIENGGGYDDFVDTMLAATDNRRVTKLNAVQISGHGGQDLNEHVWYDFPTVVAVADKIAHTLGAVDRANAPSYQANAHAFRAKLHTLEQTEASLKSAYAGIGIAITESVPLYLTDACGLVNRTPKAFSAAIEEGTDVPASALQDTLALFADGRVKALVYNEQTTGPQTDAVLAAAKDHNVSVVPVTETLPAGMDYLGWMSGNLAALKAALA